MPQVPPPQFYRSFDHMEQRHLARFLHLARRLMHKEAKATTPRGGPGYGDGRPHRRDPTLHLQPHFFGKNPLAKQQPLQSYPAGTWPALSRLRYLNLSFNSLSGIIPFSIGTLRNLSSLDLGNNRLSGEIPPLLGSSPALESVSLPNNLLDGEIPQSLANSSSPLTTLLLAQNQLQRFIPDFGKLLGLKILDLSYNNLSGTLSHSIYNLSELFFLGLANNNLGGTLPSDKGNTLPNIKILMMANNSFEGDIPASLQNASGMTFIHLGKNSLTRVIPSFSSMPNLKYVMLYSNQLEAGDWTFFSSLTNCT